MKTVRLNHYEGLYSGKMMILDYLLSIASKKLEQKGEAELNAVSVHSIITVTDSTNEKHRAQLSLFKGNALLAITKSEGELQKDHYVPQIFYQELIDKTINELIELITIEGIRSIEEKYAKL